VTFFLRRSVLRTGTAIECAEKKWRNSAYYHCRSQSTFKVWIKSVAK